MATSRLVAGVHMLPGRDRASSVHCAGTVQGPCIECSFVVPWTVQGRCLDCPELNDQLTWYSNDYEGGYYDDYEESLF